MQAAVKGAPTTDETRDENPVLALCWVAQRHTAFRLPELRALATLQRVALPECLPTLDD
eukprot:SAG11_NODE_26136_length_349_cov_0.940000_1_plen_58_part_01